VQPTWVRAAVFLRQVLKRTHELTRVAEPTVVVTAHNATVGCSDAVAGKEHSIPTLLARDTRIFSNWIEELRANVGADGRNLRLTAGRSDARGPTPVGFTGEARKPRRSDPPTPVEAANTVPPPWPVGARLREKPPHQRGEAPGSAITRLRRWFIGQHFANSVGWPIALIAFGMVMIGSAR
jgi:hypothetical protein